ncbi:glutamate 5-kinase 1 [Weizmannia acidilactici]|uniref:Glutamate 5-kinase n=1 Tax=Weizmannia acidilactici TaxID=2607726 RepID=A0A5J4JEC8_9BACI|nr:glutamate 5-kinase [Weizmannia acidilactici]GER67678.1 glutamate 5-kinase 1 [Weizmannia acidilactici]GER68917.1 glutamate 5-kinase 1 [Weizmannia acidilactici]GER73903.1 glutamate 5-kinase 1 [Weizmannia acidilactici]
MEKKRVVVKIGSSSLTNAAGEIDESKFADHIHALAALRKAGHETIVVSSGAVACGFKLLGYPSRPVTLKGKQAAAAIGQSVLIQRYREALGEHGITPAQILLTRQDFSKKDRYHNAYSTLTELLHRGVMPIVNENDSVSVTELTFGDNDMLSALVSGLIHAEQLVILTDINGLYSANPKNDPNARRFDTIEKITPDMMRMAGGAGTKVGTGGMLSKLKAANTALSLGVRVFIGTGKGENKLLRILEGKGDGTYIGGARPAVTSQKQWIALFSETAGKIYIDPGAEQALLKNGSSLLAAGIQKVTGLFQKGDVVEVYGSNGLLGKGEVLYGAEELEDLLEKQMGRATGEVIHRDKWVPLTRKGLG